MNRRALTQIPAGSPFPAPLSLSAVFGGIVLSPHQRCFEITLCTIWKLAFQIDLWFYPQI
jgi:hypothetical protein